MGGVSVLLGAGASVEAGMPTSAGMIEKLIVDFRNLADAQLGAQGAQGRLRLLEFVVYSLRQQAASRGDVDGLDVERMYNAIQALGDRRNLSIAPFISAWQPLVAEAERTAAAAERFESHDQELVRLLETAMQAKAEETRSGPANSSTAFRSLPARGVIENFIRTLLGTGDAAELVFKGLADAVLASLVSILRLETADKVRYLTPLTELYASQGSLTVATLNYDLTIETLGDVVTTPVDTGMDDWLPKQRLRFSAGIKLLKLHGSIDWKLVRHPVVAPGFTKLPYVSVQRQKGIEPDTPAVIFGAGNKLRADGPYLALLREFDGALEETDVLLVVGYSFRDDHVNTMLTSWMNTKEEKRIVILDNAADRFGEFPDSLDLSLGNYLWWLSDERPNRVRFVKASVTGGLADAIRAAREGLT
jgi:hypothetical protein